MKKWLILILAILVVMPIASANEFNHTELINISNSVASTRTNFVVKMVWNTSDWRADNRILQADCDDIRFTNSSSPNSTDWDTTYDFWLADADCDTGLNNDWIYVKIDTIGASTSKVIYIHTGNATIGSGSNGTNTFEIFEPFENGLLGLDSCDTTDDGTLTYTQDELMSGSYGLNYSEASGVNGGTAICNVTKVGSATVFEAWFKPNMEADEIKEFRFGNMISTDPTNIGTYAGHRNPGATDIPDLAYNAIDNSNVDNSASTNIPHDIWYFVVVRGKNNDGFLNLTIYNGSDHKNYWDDYTSTGSYQLNHAGVFLSTGTGQYGEIYVDNLRTYTHYDTPPTYEWLGAEVPCEIDFLQPENDTYRNWNGYNIQLDGATLTSCEYNIDGGSWISLDCADPIRIYETFDGTYTINARSDDGECTGDITLTLTDSPTTEDLIEYLKVYAVFMIIGLFLIWYLFKRNSLIQAILMAMFGLVMLSIFDHLLTYLIAFILIIYMIYVSIRSVLNVTNN